MKKSNKILLGAFATALLLLAGLHIAIYARFQGGHYTEKGYAAAQDPDIKRLPLEGVAFIKVDNVSVHIHPDESAAPLLQYSLGEEERYRIERKGDTLVLSGIEKDRNRYYSSVHITAPGGITFHISGASAFVAGMQEDSRDSTRAGAFGFVLDSTELRIGATEAWIDKPACFDSLNISAYNQSQVHLGQIRLKTLEASLTNSELTEDGMIAGRLSFRADSSSKVTLTGENLEKVR